jgi:hypothetical protein
MTSEAAKGPAAGVEEPRISALGWGCCARNLPDHDALSLRFRLIVCGHLLSPETTKSAHINFVHVRNGPITKQQ